MVSLLCKLDESCTEMLRVLIISGNSSTDNESFNLILIKNIVYCLYAVAQLLNLLEKLENIMKTLSIYNVIFKAAEHMTFPKRQI